MPPVSSQNSFAGAAFERLVAIMHRLRAPGGCPWDREQTFDSIRPHTIEETYEVLEAIGERNWAALREELGDLLLQVIFYAEMAEERSLFDIGGVLETLCDKLIRRHPHVFEDDSGRRMNADEALGRWEQMKAQEKGAPAPSLLGSAPRGLPALSAAAKLGRKAAAARFDWPDIAAIWRKVDEETAEFRDALKAPDSAAASAREEEFGDLLFTLVNLARRLEIEPEAALHRANVKFRRRFAWMERRAREEGKKFDVLTPEAMDALWNEAKRAEAGQELQ